MNEITTIKTQNDLLAYANEFVKSNNIIVSKNYDLTNAMVSLYTNVLTAKDKNGRSVLETCTPLSIQNAIAECITDELTPRKNQTYFIAYGNELTSQKSYFGNSKKARDVAGVSIKSQVVRDGDQIDMETRVDGSLIIHHKPSVKNLDKPIAYAYAVATDIATGRVVDSDIMSIAEIKKSWSKSRNGGAVSREFPHEMARRTVINRLAKHFINTSDDSNKILITDIDGKTIQVNQYGELPIEEYDYTINTQEQIDKEKQKYEPAEGEDVVTMSDLQVTPIENEPAEIPENAIEIDYNLVKGGQNRDKYRVVPNTFNKSKYTCMAVPLE